MRVPTKFREILTGLIALSFVATACAAGAAQAQTTTIPVAAPATAIPDASAILSSSTAIIASECGGDGAIPARAPVANLSVAIVAPSAEKDHAFTHSMTDSLSRLGMDYEITENAFMLDVAAAAIEGYAQAGNDVVIAHGTQYGDLLTEIAPNYPTTSFLWGTSTSTLGLPNVFAYYAEAQQGAYVNGWMAAEIAYGYPIAVVGPFKAGDAVLYINGFTAGAQANGADGVSVTYTGSFSDADLASEAAAEHLDAGAKVLTGTSQSAVGAVTTAAQSDVPWFGTQSNRFIGFPVG